MKEITKSNDKIELWKQFFRWLNHDVVEIRVVGFPVHKVFYQNVNVTSAEEFAEICGRYNGEGQVYFSVQARDGKGGKYENVPFIDFFPIDIDAVRPNKQTQPADSEQRGNAFQNSEKILKYLEKQGVKPSLIVDTGNGILILVKTPHMDTKKHFYNIGGEVRNKLSDKINVFYEEIRSLHDATVVIDSVGDLPRILGVPGTINLKGGRTREIVGGIDTLETQPVPQPKMWQLIAAYSRIPPSGMRVHKRTEFKLTFDELVSMLPDNLQKDFQNPEKVNDRSLSLVRAIRYFANKMRFTKEECIYTMDILTRKIGRERWPASQQFDREVATGKIKPQGIKETPFIELSDGRLCEQAFDGKEIFYLIYNPKTDTVERSSQVEEDDVTYRPINSEDVWKQLVLLPSAVEHYENEQKLTDEIRDYLNRWHEPPSHESRVLDVCYSFLTYIKDLIPQLPYRRFLAKWGRGKSAWLDTLGSICYRGLILAGSDTDKSFVRRMNNWQGTALVDEADFGKSSLYSFIIKVLNIGYDRKTGFYQRCDDDDPTKTLVYDVYGPKVIATRRKYKDSALESRCLTTIGRQNLKPMPLFRMGKFLQESQLLRNKLIYWRFKNYHKIKEEAKRLEEPSIAEEVYGKNANISSRIKQVILPLWLVGGDSLKKSLKQLATHVDGRMKVEDPDYLLELRAKDSVEELVKEVEDNSIEKVNVVKVLNVLIEGGGKKQIIYEINLTTISKKILTKFYGKKEEEITREDKISVSKKISRIFETNLGFTIRIGAGRRRVVQIPKEWIRPVDLEDFS